MDLNSTRMFVAVGRSGSLSAAADLLGVPLPTLSRRIRELERELGVQLLERSVRGTRLTDAGARLYGHASRGIEALEDGERSLRDDQAQLKGRLRLSLPPAFEPWWILLARFRQQYPDIQLQIYTTERRVDPIEDGIDVALRVGDIVHDSMVARPVLRFRHLLVASPQLLAQQGTPITPEALREFLCAVWGLGGDTQASWQLGDATIQPQTVLVTNDYAHLLNLALQGELVTELPSFLAAAPISEGRLVSLLPDYPMPEQQLHLVYPSHRHPSTLVRTYLEFCQHQAPEILQQAAPSSD